ncbi:membrane protease YdiL (CAAX protease family) [Anaerotaenia torta]|uniref:CPBP family intramembrane glutamic endopeptidase n=1 Tax=Anaerotaenia torta TaxID=433293 RepID=UPI003D212749
MNNNPSFRQQPAAGAPASRPAADPKLETKRIILYLAITFILTYLVEIAVIRPMVTGEDAQLALAGQSLVSGMMFVPALGVFLTRLITKEGFRNTLLILPKLKTHLPYYLIAWFGPGLLTLLGAGIYFALNPSQFDPNLPILVERYQNAGVEVSVSQLRSSLLIQTATALLIGPLVNLINCFGEEWGWRGYLLPKMKEKFKIIPMLLINGVIWGLWHAPLTALGHNYGLNYKGFPFTGILAMIIFCIVMGTIFSFLTIRTKSCIPAAFAHGGLNSIAAAGLYLTENGGNPFIGPAPTGFLGGIGFIAAAVVMAVLMIKDEKRRSAYPAGSQPGSPAGSQPLS